MSEPNVNIHIGVAWDAFLDEHQIEFIKFGCSTPQPKADIKVYAVADDSEWAAIQGKYVTRNQNIVLEGHSWSGCICNPKSDDHQWIGHYKCRYGWTFPRVMAAIRHNYLWGRLAAYFSTQWWMTSEPKKTARAEDVYIGPLSFPNKIAEAAYVLDIELTNNKFISYNFYT